MAADPTPEQGLFNTQIEDALAAHGGTAEADAAILQALMTLAAEYHARAVGRRATVTALDNIRGFVKTARPIRPWRA